MPSCSVSGNKGVLTSYCKSGEFAARFYPTTWIHLTVFVHILITRWRGKFLGISHRTITASFLITFIGSELLFYINPSLPAWFSNWSSLISLQIISLIFSVAIAGKGPTQKHSPHPTHNMQTDKGKTNLCMVYILLGQQWVMMQTISSEVVQFPLWLSRWNYLFLEFWQRSPLWLG